MRIANKILSFTPTVCLFITSIVAAVVLNIFGGLAVLAFAVVSLIASLVPQIFKFKVFKVDICRTYDIVKTVLFCLIAYGYMFCLGMMGGSSDYVSFNKIVSMMLFCGILAILGITVQCILYKLLDDKEDDDPTKFMPFDK